jgi:hypothetical protein
MKALFSVDANFTLKVDNNKQSGEKVLNFPLLISIRFYGENYSETDTMVGEQTEPKFVAKTRQSLSLDWRRN